MTSEKGTERSAAGTAGGDAFARTPEVPSGTLVGRYMVIEPLGHGAMGVVYRAYDPELDRAVALKLVRWGTEEELEGKAQERLLREGKALARLAHPNVVAVHDVGTHAGHAFVAMELVEGETLHGWLQGAHGPGEIVAMFVQAGRGLAAAHEAGVVHRDFKPSNVIVGKDGRPRVVDFGVAFAGGGDVETPSLDAEGPTLAGDGSLASLRSPRALVGTPRYIAPEQALGTGTGPASDQFSFCVSLWEALSGERPFRGHDLMDMLTEVQQGVVRDPGPRMPGWVRAVLQRGLAAEAGDRYPSMSALVDVLARDPAVARRRFVAFAAAGLAVLAVAALAVWRVGATKDPCTDSTATLRGIWDDGVKERLRAAFVGTGRPYASDTAARTTALLDGYADAYGSMRHDVCEASRRGEGSRELLTLRDACLERRRGQLQAVAAVLSDRPDPDVLDRAVSAAAGLSPVAYCADIEALTARVRPPDDAALRDRVASVQPSVDRLDALYSSGKYKVGLAAGEPLLAEAQAMPYLPLRAQIEYEVGLLVERTGDYERAKSLLRDAAAHAAEGRDDVLVANAWSRILYVLGERQRHFEEARAVESVGPTLLARARDDRAIVGWLSAEGLLLQRMGKHAEAATTLERALAIAEKALGPEHPQVATVLNNLGMAQNDAGDRSGALATHERALAMRRRVLGPEHPSVAQSLNNLGLTLKDEGDLARALEAYEQAAALWEKDLGPEHPDVAQALNNVATTREDLGDLAGATTIGERALAIRERALGPDHPDVAQSLFNVAMARHDAGDDARAAPLLERALAILEKALGPEHHDLAYALLGLGRVRVRLGQLDDAARLLERARLLVDRPGALEVDEARDGTLLGLGELALARGRPREAGALLERALGHALPMNACEIRLTLADALWPAGGDRPRALDLVREARASYGRTGNQPGVERCGRWLAAHPAP